LSLPVPPDPWAKLRGLTPARIALGRSGASLPTHEVLAFALDHARARDAVHTPFDAPAVAAQIKALGHAVLTVSSAAADRATYLRRPDLGRKLSADDEHRLDVWPRTGFDLCVVVCDGLSSAAVHTHAAALIAALEPHVAQAGWKLAPVVLAHQGRVALGDEVAARLGARMVATLVGERPGLSSPDSLGAYLTYGPRRATPAHPGRSDAERNCISNIRAQGLSYEAAAFKMAWHVGEALRLSLTGVGLKDESDLALARVGASSTAALPPP
jgi:ethanolamine ammonia-lyase small subunit